MRYISDERYETQKALKSLFLAICLALFTLTASAEPYSFLTVEAKPGDGMYALLRRFDLPVNSCYIDKFLALNELSQKQELQVGVTYNLPILVYTYNGKSIRSTLGINDMPLAKKIQSYNRERRKVGQKQGAYEKTRVLWVPYGHLFCDNSFISAQAAVEKTTTNVSASQQAPAEAEDVQTNAKSVTSTNKGFAIFGEKYANVKAKNQKLKGKVFYLVSGHGGPDPGAVGSKMNNSLCEDEYAYDVVLRLARNIVEHGGIPYVIVRDRNDGIRDEELLPCDYDEQVWGDLAIPRDQRLRLMQRSDAINQLADKHKNQGVKDQFCLVVHVDSRHEETQTDLFFYHQYASPKSKRLTTEMHATMERNYKRNKRSRTYKGAILTRDLHMLREVDVPTVYIELGNIQHEFDQKRVLQPRNRQALANWFVEGILKGI